MRTRTIFQCYISTKQNFRLLLRKLKRIAIKAKANTKKRSPFHLHCSWDAENFNLVSQILFFSLIEHNYFIISSFHSSTLFFITFKSLNVKREKRKLLEKREQREEFDRPHFNHIKS